MDFSVGCPDRTGSRSCWWAASRATCHGDVRFSVNQQVADIAPARWVMTPQGWNGSIYQHDPQPLRHRHGPHRRSDPGHRHDAGADPDHHRHATTSTMIDTAGSSSNGCSKPPAAILLVTNTWNLVMGVFDVAQGVVALRRPASSVRTPAIDITSVITDMESPA